ncbi:hypothetical protein D8T56_04245 [Vibrio vulnificus]|nr:hypothetical protein D8T56_04245 [Vibrio vulnificus]
MINEQTKVKGHWLDLREGNKLNHVARDKKEGKSMTNRWRIKKNAPEYTGSVWVSLRSTEPRV